MASLARPGGNVTGVSGLLGGGFAGKWVELLKQAAPRITRVWALRDAGNPVTARLTWPAPAIRRRLLDFPPATTPNLILGSEMKG